MKKKEQRISIIYVVLLTVFSVILLHRCKFGFADIDESLYLAIPYRFVQGDAPFVNEWNLSQFSSILLVPLVKLYLFITGGTESIVLIFRYIYLFVNLFVSVFIYTCMKKYSHIGAMAASLLFFVYAPFGIPALSYNSMGIIFLSLALVIFITFENIVGKFFSGVAYSASVLCCPFLALISLLYFIYIILKREKINLAIAFFWGIIISVVIFGVYVLWHANPSDLLRAIPFVLDDDGHKVKIRIKLITYMQAVIFDKVIYFIYGAYIVCLLIGIRLKKYKENAIVATLIITGFYVIYTVITCKYINMVVFPVNIAGLICYLINKDERIKPVFWYIWIPGMMYTLCIHFASDQAFYNISSAGLVALTGTYIIVFESVKKIRTAKCLFLVIAILQFSFVFYYRYNSIFWDRTLSFQTERIELGSHKGLIVSNEKNEYYRERLEELKLIDTDIESIAFFSNDTWLYLQSDRRNGNYSAWIPLHEDDKIIDKIKNYYSFEVNKLPDAFFIDKDFVDIVSPYAKEMGYIFSYKTDKESAIMYRER